ncbi:MAG: restriction endonuclease subunit S, partial [Bacillota bacterium]
MSEVAEVQGREGLRRFKPYPVYKDSGVEWLGEIPAHWEVRRIGDCAPLINGFPFDSQYFVRSVGVPLLRIRDLYRAETEVNYIGPIVQGAWIETGEIIVGMDGDFNVARWQGPRALLNQRMCCLRPLPDNDAAFIAYLLPLPLKVINDLTYSTTVKHLSSDDVRKIRFGWPPLPEQRAIAAFLDRETTNIDALVAKKERLIELLQEKRTALITRAVTKGLDPNVPMKDSGVEWLGEIPAHWEVRRLKHVVHFIGGGTPAKDDVGYWQGHIPWVSPKDMKVSIIVNTEDKITPRAIRESATKPVPAGAVLMVVRSA